MTKAQYEVFEALNPFFEVVTCSMTLVLTILASKFRAVPVRSIPCFEGFTIRPPRQSKLNSICIPCRRTSPTVVYPFLRNTEPSTIAPSAVNAVLNSPTPRVAKIHWPNGSHSEFSRTEAGCVGKNITFDADGSINFFVGMYAVKPGTFSPLVEFNSQPNYPCCPGTEFRPHWPNPLGAYSRP
jgi:hypothetical protein